MRWRKVTGILLVIVGLTGFGTVADDFRHSGELLGVGGIPTAGLVLLVAGSDNRIMRRIALLILLAGSAPGWAGTARTTEDCEEARRTNLWCSAGNAGYVAGVEIRSPFLYEALDAHGHDVEPAAIACDVCRKAVAGHGFCPAHRLGFAGGHAFVSPLTYYLARSRTIDPAALSCRVCRRHTRGIGWCDRHRVGIAGRFALDDRREFDQMQKAYGILLAAVEMSSRCERCAAAMVADGYCAIHRVHYTDGRAASGSPP